MKIVLVSMVRNEAKILQRCLEAVEDVVDAFCVCDTGSTDDTVEIATEFVKTRRGIVFGCEWKDFGHNRTLSFQGAQTYVRDQLGWDLKDTYGLLLDADMVFVPNTLREQVLTEVGYTIVQCAGNLEYPNCRLIRMDRDWTCRGVTHEYWDGPTTPLPKSVCHIDDRNDGGCKSDKFERDVRLLEKGLQDDPTNVRYMFYLAQTYHSSGRWKDAITMYKKRIAAGGWDEEQWYSMYMIGQSYLQLEDPIRFESWMLRAHKFRPGRAESLYKLTKYFRETSQHYKAWNYMLQGVKIPMSSDSLFIEKDVYTHLFAYERTILGFYVGADGLRDTTDYLLKHTYARDNVFTNLQFYIQPMGPGTPMNIPRDFFGKDFHPGSVCVWSDNGKLVANVRYVNYRLDPVNRSTYEMSLDGVYSTGHTVKTQNAYYEDGSLRAMQDESIVLPRHESHIRGLEDVRVFKKKDGLYMTATTLEFSPNLQILYGKYCPKTLRYENCRVLKSPYGKACEKNWLGISNTDDIIYDWHPLRIGSVEENDLKIHTEHATPSFFSHMRGSAPPVRIDDELWVMTHIVEYSTPRKYYHILVVLDAHTYAPRRMSCPFVFERASVEYCLGMTADLQCVYSSMDDNPKLVTLDRKNLHWTNLRDICEQK